jgi:preprotein translocase subunit SecF
MTTHVKTFSWFGLIAVAPCVACVGFLAYIAIDLDRHTLAAVFTVVGAFLAYGGSQIKE